MVVLVNDDEFVVFSLLRVPNHRFLLIRSGDDFERNHLDSLHTLEVSGHLYQYQRCLVAWRLVIASYKGHVPNRLESNCFQVHGYADTDLPNTHDGDHPSQ